MAKRRNCSAIIIVNPVPSAFIGRMDWFKYSHRYNILAVRGVAIRVRIRAVI
jgi:hypothetical protein